MPAWRCWHATSRRDGQCTLIQWWRFVTNDYCSGRSSDRSVSRGTIVKQFRTWFVRLGGFFRRNRSERDLVAEIESHLRMHMEDNLGADTSTSEARREALMKLGEGRWPSPTPTTSSLSVRFGRAIQATASSLRQTSTIGTTKAPRSKPWPAIRTMTWRSPQVP